MKTWDITNIELKNLIVSKYSIIDKKYKKYIT